MLSIRVIPAGQLHLPSSQLPIKEAGSVDDTNDERRTRACAHESGDLPRKASAGTTTVPEQGVYIVICASGTEYCNYSGPFVSRRAALEVAASESEMVANDPESDLIYRVARLTPIER